MVKLLIFDPVEYLKNFRLLSLEQEEPFKNIKQRSDKGSLSFLKNHWLMCENDLWVG